MGDVVRRRVSPDTRLVPTDRDLVAEAAQLEAERQAFLEAMPAAVLQDQQQQRQRDQQQQQQHHQQDRRRLYQ